MRLFPLPLIPGGDVAGKIVKVWSKVTRLHIGDEVYGDLSACGRGSFAEYVCAPETVLEKKPKNLSMSESAGVPEASLVALQWLERVGNIQSGQNVLIHGSSGGIGSFMVQIARMFWAHVTAVSSTRNKDLVRSLWAEKVIDYTKEDFAKNSEKYDLILTTRGYRWIMDFVNSLKTGGTYVTCGWEVSQFFQTILLGPVISLFTRKRIKPLILKTNVWLDRMTAWIENGDIRPLIDREYSLEEVGKALEYVEAWHARGKVIIKIR
jgi:NADPH:quinone reductase-like Zn-dependent oxidoreductase